MELPNKAEEYRSGHLAEWSVGSTKRYGGVVFNARGEVLLREPSKHFDGYHWTFSKGAANPAEHPVDAALRETHEETGYRAAIIGHLRDGYGGTSTGWVAYYFVMTDSGAEPDEAAVTSNGETSQVRWVSADEAEQLISQTTNEHGRERDLAVLKDAVAEFQRLQDE